MELREILTGIAENCVSYSDDGRLHVQKLILTIAGQRMPEKEQAALRAEHEENEQREEHKRREEEKTLDVKIPPKHVRANGHAPKMNGHDKFHVIAGPAW